MGCRMIPPLGNGMIPPLGNGMNPRLGNNLIPPSRNGILYSEAPGVRRPNALQALDRSSTSGLGGMVQGTPADSPPSQ